MRFWSWLLLSVPVSSPHLYFTPLSTIRITHHHHHHHLSVSFFFSFFLFGFVNLIHEYWLSTNYSVPTGLVCFSWILILNWGLILFFDKLTTKFENLVFIYLVELFSCWMHSIATKQKILGRIVYLVIFVWLIALNSHGYACLI